MPAPRADFRQTVGRLSRSLRLQLNILFLMFLTLPVLIYSVFNAADAERQVLLLDTVRDSGLLIGKALAPMLATLPASDFGRLPAELARFDTPGRSVKLLFKPSTGVGGAGFFYVAAVPAVPTAQLENERQSLISLGVLDRLAESCSGNTPLAKRVEIPGDAGEILTSVSSVRGPSGCWAVVIAADTRGTFDGVDQGTYLGRPKTQLALLVYAAMALLAFIVFANVRAGLSRLKETAQAVEAGGQFASSVSIPELEPAARELDRMVERLREAATTIRQSAEDNAHALKGPIGTIRQVLEPLGGESAVDDRLHRALAVCTIALDRLEGLVRSARRLDTATAELLAPSRQTVDLSELVGGFVRDTRLTLGAEGERLVARITPDLLIFGNDELVETILENLVDNALSFTPEHGRVFIDLGAEDEQAVLTVRDEGPGVAPAHIDHIFERYYSVRPETPGGEAGAGGGHFGVGLWLVRHNTVALGGSIAAANRPEGGFEVTVRLPLA